MTFTATLPGVTLSPLEIALGFAFGRLPDARRAPRTDLPARQAFEKPIRDALQAAPCFVLFSGGRDSSAVLATATSVARAEGLALPIPVTYRYPGLKAADESEWQDLVVRHLQLDDWIQREVHEGLDILSPLAQEALLRYGPLYPALGYKFLDYFRSCGQGTYLTGEGGDEVLDPKRVHTLRYLVKSRPMPPPRSVLIQASRELAPGPIRAYRVRRATLKEPRPWLRPETHKRLARILMREELSEPLDWRRATWRDGRSRGQHLGMELFNQMAADSGCRVVHPFLEPGFVAAFARSGGWLGHSGRTGSMRYLFADLLPDELLSRSTKAYFNSAMFSDHVRAFVRDWDGSGVPADYVDPEQLRGEWLSEFPHGGTALLLQAAWLAAQQSGRPEERRRAS